MSGVTPLSAAIFAAAIVLQLIMISVLPLTRGYTNLLPTAVCIVCINLAILALARLALGGAQLSLLIPLSSAIIPLVAIAIGVVIYKEPASVSKIALLAVSCGLIGLASRN